MQKNIYNIENFRKINLFSDVYKGLDLINQINIAMLTLYGSPITSSSWNTVLYNHPVGPLDSMNKDKTCNEYLDKIKHAQNTTPLTSSTDIFLHHFICTREYLSEKSIILGFFNIENCNYRRYLISDIKKLCRLFRVSDIDFPGIFGESSKKNKFYNIPHDKEVYHDKICKLVQPTSNIKIQHSYINKMIEYFNNNGCVVYYIQGKNKWETNQKISTNS